MKIKLALIAATLFAAQAQAAEWPDNAFYAGVGVGQSKLKGDLADPLQQLNSVPGMSFDDKDTSGKFLIGKRFNRNFAIEAQYNYLGKFTAEGAGVVPGYGASRGSVSATGRSLGLDAVLTLPLTQKFGVLGRVGIARNRVDGDAYLQLGKNIGTAHERGYTTDPKYGLGLEYKFSDKLAVRGEYERQRIKFDDVKSNVDTASVSLVYTFGSRPATVVHTTYVQPAPAPVYTAPAPAPVVEQPAPAPEAPVVTKKKVRE